MNDDDAKKLGEYGKYVIDNYYSIKKMVDDDRFIDDILIQLSAVHMSIKSFANIILEDYIHSNVIKDLKQDKLDTIAEVIEMFKRFQ